MTKLTSPGSVFQHATSDDPEFDNLAGLGRHEVYRDTVRGDIAARAKLNIIIHGRRR